MNVLLKGKTNIDIFKLISRQKKRSKMQSENNKNSSSNNNKNNNDNGLSRNDLKVPIPSLKDMEFSWSENF